MTIITYFQGSSRGSIGVENAIAEIQRTFRATFRQQSEKKTVQQLQVLDYMLGYLFSTYILIPIESIFGDYTTMQISDTRSATSNV